MAIFDDEDFNELKKNQTTLTMQNTINIKVCTH